MIHRVESDAKFPNFERVFFLPADLEALYPIPVSRLELSVIVGQKGGTLEPGEVSVHQRLRSVVSAVKVETHGPCTSVICILDDFLSRMGCRYRSTECRYSTSYIQCGFFSLEGPQGGKHTMNPTVQ